MTRTKVTAELTVEQQIAQIQKEAQDKIKQLQAQLPWNTRFKTAFSRYAGSNSAKISAYCNGYELVDSNLEDSINAHLTAVNLKIKFVESTFTSTFYKHGAGDIIDSPYDLSEYPVYTVFSITEDNKVVGHVQVNCNYSSYNGNEYSSWSFVEPKEITCTVFVKSNLK